MAQSVRDIVHNLYSAFAAGDAAAALALLHPRVVWVEAENAPYVTLAQVTVQADPAPVSR